METNEKVMALIKRHLPFGADLQDDIKENCSLVELGIDSLHLVTMLLTLQREYSIDMESLTENGMPSTVSDLVALVDPGRAAGSPPGSATKTP